MSELINCINNLSAKDIIKSVAKTANGVPFYLQTSGLGGFCAEYQAVYDTLTTPPSSAIATAQNSMVASLVDSGIWAKLDTFYLFAQTVNSAGEAYVNWKNPGTYNCTEILGGGSISFNANEGLLGDGTAVLNTNWNPATNGVNFVQDSAGITVGIYNDGSAAKYISGVFDGSNYSCLLRPRDAGNTVFLRMNAAAVIESIANANSKKHLSLRRTTAAASRLGINKVHSAKAGASAGVPSAVLYVLGYNNNGAAAGQNLTHRIMYLATHSGLSDADSDSLVDPIETYLDTNGKGLIP